MKKLTTIFLSCILLLCFSFNTEAIVIKQVTKKWDAVSVAPDTDWFSVDLAPIERNNNAVKHTFQFMCPTSTVVNMQLTFNAITKAYDFNSGVAIPANVGMQFSVIIHKDMTYNIQHKTGTQNCSVTISESSNIDL